MNWIKNERFISYNKGRAVVLADVEMDAAGDLPEVNAFSGRLLAKGSVAHDINTGEYYCLNSSGIWKKQKSASELSTASSAVLMGVTTAEPVFGDLKVTEVK